MTLALFGVLPYLALAIFIVGHVWRWKYDQWGWTTRTSQLLEKRWLMWGSPIFHIGMLMVVGGHALGLLIPAAATRALGMSDHAYHLMAVGAGVTAGLVLVLGLVILLVRRFVTKTRMRIVTMKADIVMYILFGLTVAAGLLATLLNNVILGDYDYRSTISIWFRSLFVLQPNIEVMAGVPWLYQVHMVSALALIAVWPFTRLVHLWSIPFGFFARPDIVYHARKS